MQDYNLPISISEEIIRIRKDRDLTQMELAHMAGISRSYLSRIERMESIPSLKTIRKIEDALGLPPMALTAAYQSCNSDAPVSPDIDLVVQNLSRELNKGAITAEDLRQVEKILSIVIKTYSSMKRNPL